MVCGVQKWVGTTKKGVFRLAAFAPRPAAVDNEPFFGMSRRRLFPTIPEILTVFKVEETCAKMYGEGAPKRGSHWFAW